MRKKTEPQSRALPFEIQVRRTIERFHMIEPRDHVLVAVSGGADSTALLLCLQRLGPIWKLSLTVAHFNHGIRGAEGDGDEAFARGLAASLDLPFVAGGVPVKTKAAAGKRNLEEVSREERYGFLEGAASKIGAGKIATGHTLDDQAETALLRFLRGSGPEGLAGIFPVVEGRLIRPLIESSRSQVLQYLKVQKAFYREDSTNMDQSFLRNRTRHELIPYLKKNFNPRLVETLAREAELARQINDYLELQAEATYVALAVPIKGGISLRVAELMELHPALRQTVVRHAIKAYCGSLRGIESRHIQKVLDLCRSRSSGRRIELPHGNIVLRQFQSLLFIKADSLEQIEYRYMLPVPGSCKVPEAGLMFVARVENAEPHALTSATEAWSVRLDAAALPAELSVRSRLPGDCYGGPPHRKVKKMLIDAKIPQPERSLLPMVVAGMAVIWIPGFKPARDFIPRAGCRRSVLIQANPL